MHASGRGPRDPTRYRPAQFRTALRCPNDKRRGVPDCGRAFRVRQFAMSRQTREALLARAKEEAAAAERRDAVSSDQLAQTRMLIPLPDCTRQTRLPMRRDLMNC